jgi:hypothetical protein
MHLVVEFVLSPNYIVASCVLFDIVKTDRRPRAAIASPHATGFGPPAICGHPPAGRGSVHLFVAGACGARASPACSIGRRCPRTLGQHNAFRGNDFSSLSRCPTGVDAVAGGGAPMRKPRRPSAWVASWRNEPNEGKLNDFSATTGVYRSAMTTRAIAASRSRGAHRYRQQHCQSSTASPSRLPLWLFMLAISAVMRSS